VRCATAALVVLLFSLLSFAQTRRSPQERAAEEVQAAHRARDASALERLAAREVPDPWVVSDELCGRGEHEAALAFAAVVRSDDREDHLTCIRAERDNSVPVEIRRRLREAEQANLRRDYPRVLEVVEADVSGRHVCAVRFHRQRVGALVRLRRYEEAATDCRRGQEIALELGWRSEAISLLHQQALCLSSAAKIPMALRVWKEQLELAERWKLTKSATSARTAIAICYRKLGRLEDALTTLLRVEKDCERVGDRSSLASALNSLGNTYRLLGRSDEALDSFRRALELYDELSDRAAAARTLNNLGVLQKQRGEYVAALEHYERSLRIKKDLGDRRGAAVTLGNMGSVYKRLGAYRKALSHELDALERLEARKDSMRVAGFSTNVGNTYRRLGELHLALTFMRRGLSLSREIRSPHLEATALNALALVHYDLGCYAESLRMLEAGLELARKHGFRKLQGSILNNFGLIHQALGDHKTALGVFRKSFALKQASGDRGGMANSLANMANAYEAFRDLDSALAHLERAEKIYGELNDAVSLAWTLGEIGGVLRRMGDPERALAKHRKALSISRRLSDRPGEICSLRHIGEDLVHLGKPEEARSVLVEALAVADEVGGGRLVAEALYRLAEVQLSTGNPEAAIAHARRAVREISRSAGGLAEEQGAGVRERYLGVYDTGLLAAAQLKDREQFYHFLECGRAGALLEFLGGRNRLQAFLVPEELRTSLQLGREAESLAAHALSRARKGGKREEIRSRRAALDESRADVRKVIQRIQREAKAASDVLYREPASLAEIRSFLLPGDAMVLYALTGTDALALVVTPERVGIVPLGGADGLRQAVAALPFTSPTKDPADTLRDLQKRLVLPLGLEEGTKRILISPHDVLSEVPFALLTDLEVAYVPSATTFGVLRAEHDRRGAKVLALGHPDYRVALEDETLVARLRGGRLTPLPATQDEVKAVGDVLLLGKDATETRLVAAIAGSSRWRAVHLACHGVIDTERPAFSALAVTPDPGSDGFLTCLEIFRMNIPADLVVLSACETARGKVCRAEGIMGLTRAFMMAGAPRVLCSLWKVDDEATKTLMVKFYELWNPKEGKGLPAVTSLKRAQKFVRSHDEWKHPHYWAAWVLWGLPD